MCRFSLGKPGGLVKPKPLGCISPLWVYSPHSSYFSFPSGWEYSSSPPPPQPPLVLIKVALPLAVVPHPVGLCSTVGSMILWSHFGFLSGKVSSHRAISAKPHAWPVCTHIKGKSPPNIHPCQYYSGAWMTFSLFRESGGACLKSSALICLSWSSQLTPAGQGTLSSQVGQRLHNSVLV